MTEGRCRGYFRGNYILNFRAPSLYGPCLIKIIPSQTKSIFKSLTTNIIKVPKTFYGLGSKATPEGKFCIKI